MSSTYFTGRYEFEYFYPIFIVRCAVCQFVELRKVEDFGYALWLSWWWCVESRAIQKSKVGMNMYKKRQVPKKCGQDFDFSSEQKVSYSEH